MSGDDSQHRDVRAAKLKLERVPGEGVTLCVEAGKLRLRFFVDGQWQDLLQEVSSEEDEGQLVPFKMKPIPVSALASDQKDAEEVEAIITSSTIGAHPIPGLSGDDPAHDTPLWQNAFPSLRAQEKSQEEES